MSPTQLPEDITAAKLRAHVDRVAPRLGLDTEVTVRTFRARRTRRTWASVGVAAAVVVGLAVGVSVLPDLAAMRTGPAVPEPYPHEPQTVPLSAPLFQLLEEVTPQVPLVELAPDLEPAWHLDGSHWVAGRVVDGVLVTNNFGYDADHPFHLSEPGFQAKVGISMATGDELWRTEYADELPSCGPAFGSPYADGPVLACTTDDAPGRVEFLDPATGEVLGENEFDLVEDLRPHVGTHWDHRVVVDGVVVGHEDWQRDATTLVAAELGTGTIRWRYASTESLQVLGYRGDAVLVVDGVGSMQLLALSLVSGRELWRATVDAPGAWLTTVDGYLFATSEADTFGHTLTLLRTTPEN